VNGAYELRFTLRPDLVSTTVTLRRDGAVAFAATFRGRPEPATRRSLARLLIREPLMTQRVSTLIRGHGIWLWLRGLPVHARPPATAGRSLTMTVPNGVRWQLQMTRGPAWT
jgi:DUF1365 family protein